VSASFQARRRSDGLGLRHAIPERMLPCLVAAMAFLASLALAGAIGAHLLALRWNAGAGAILTVQVPDPDAAASAGPESRIDAVMAQLARTPELAGMHRLDPAELRRLLQPWLGGSGDVTAVPLPAVVQLRLAPRADAPPALAASLGRIAPGTLVEDSGAWSERLLALTTSLQACAALALLTVASVAGCVVVLATRAGIATRHHAIEIVHGLGATDGYIAGRFARRAAALALFGGAAGALVALPVLAVLSYLAAPFASNHLTPASLPGAQTGTPESGVPAPNALDAVLALPGMLPLQLLIALPALPVAAGLIGWVTAQGTVRVWLRRLP
jgi:cell division transport system permease protein